MEINKDSKPGGYERASDSKMAPGMTGVEGLNRDATAEEIAEGNATKVTKLEYDEYDTSGS